MPRTDRVEFTLAVPFLKVSDGITWPRDSALPMALSRSSSWLATLTPSGTFCRFSERFWAVTITSATVSFDAAARAGDVASTAVDAAASQSPRCNVFFMSVNLPAVLEVFEAS